MNKTPENSGIIEVDSLLGIFFWKPQKPDRLQKATRNFGLSSLTTEIETGQI